MSESSSWPTTEQMLAESYQLDEMDTLEILELINREDAKVAASVRECIPNISAAVDDIVRSMRRGGRLVQVGCGTSGRLAVLGWMQ